LRVVVLGAGGIGSVVAAHLARAGNEVLLVARGEQLAAISAHGLRVRGLAAFRVELAAAETAVGPCDALVVATKTPDTKAALRAVAELEPAVAFSVQNGVLKNDQLAEAFGRERVLGAITMIGGTRSAPGIVDFTLDGVTVLGELAGPVSPRVERLAAVWNAAGLQMLAVDDVAGHEWAKQVLQAGVSPLAVLTGLPGHRLWGTPALATALVRLLREAAAVAQALGVELTDYDGYGFDVRAVVTEPFAAAVARVMRRGEQLAAAGKTDIVVSMLQDVRAGRRTEIEETVGHVVREGARLGVPVPGLTLACDLVRGIEAARGQSGLVTEV